MSRAPRWWRPAPRRNVRPALRAARPSLPTSGRFSEVWHAGYRAGLADDTTPAERDHHAQQWEQLRRLDAAADAAEAGDMSLLEAFVDGDPAADDLLDVADAAGVTPLPDVDGDELAADVEAWLREQGGRR